MTDARRHVIELTSSFLGNGWTAVCSCGWTGTREVDVRRATSEANEHRANPRADEQPGGRSE